MARPKNEFETWVDRFPVGTKARIDAVLEPKEARTDFVREAVEALIRKRSRPTGKKAP